MRRARNSSSHLSRPLAALRGARGKESLMRRATMMKVRRPFMTLFIIELKFIESKNTETDMRIGTVTRRGGNRP